MGSGELLTFACLAIPTAVGLAALFLVADDEAVDEALRDETPWGDVVELPRLRAAADFSPGEGADQAAATRSHCHIAHDGERFTR